MKNYLLLITFLFIGCAPTGTIITFDDEKSNAIRAHYQNYEANNDPSLTRKQMLDILNDLYIDYVEQNYNLIKYGDTNPKNELQESKVFQKLNGFLIGLN